MSGAVVYLVGAGPGDPGLLTVRALELLRAAEVVAHDKLVPEAILALASPAAERLVVGRLRGEARRAFRLHPEVLARARAGRMVVRLKCGDPMVFGRGAEEAEDLAAAGIPYEIVPGVSAALGAAAYAGIPLTDRRCASSVTLTTGHDGHPTDVVVVADAPAVAPAPALPDRGTVVLYMGASNLSDNLARLIEGGRAPSTPAAYIERATERAQRVILGTLSDLAARVAGAEPGPDGPAVVIVGEVVRLRPRTGWRERRPLSGRRVLVASAQAAADAQLIKELRRLGAAVDETLAPPPPRAPDLVVLSDGPVAAAFLAGPGRVLAASVPMIAADAQVEHVARAAGAAMVSTPRHGSTPSLIAAVLSKIGLGSPDPSPLSPPVPSPLPPPDPSPLPPPVPSPLPPPVPSPLPPPVPSPRSAGERVRERGPSTGLQRSNAPGHPLTLALSSEPSAPGRRPADGGEGTGGGTVGRRRAR